MHTMIPAAPVRAFTLVELSIVLVILGLLVGGVLAGQSLIRAAELRAVTREADQYKTALNVFKDQYFALPGDMPNAVRYWGTQAGGTADGRNSTCAELTSPATGAPTCNGNGDGRIYGADGGESDLQGYEMWRAWQHLANAGLVEGQYSGIELDENSIGRSMPRSKLSSGGWQIESTHFTNFSLTLAIFAAGEDPVMKPGDAYAIDLKSDDGFSRSGLIVAKKQACSINPDTDEMENYQLQDTRILCDLHFITSGPPIKLGD